MTAKTHTPQIKTKIEHIFKKFQINVPLTAAVTYGNGHINDTYLITAGQQYIFQRINHHVFPDPVGLMANTIKVTAHIRDKLRTAGAGDVARRVLQLVAARDGRFYAFDAEGYLWRVSDFVTDTISFEQVENAHQAYTVARSFGEFQAQLADIRPEELHETIPDFHNTRARFTKLVQAIELDTVNRAKDVQPQIAFALQREGYSDRLLDLHAQGHIPLRVTHNDAKLGNLLFDAKSGQAICVTDLDTVMPGLALYDFGDMVRSVGVSTAEDNRNPDKVALRLDLFTALARGYLDATRDMLTPHERANLVFSGKLITYETGIRFLTDYLQGDVYFKVRRANHNLDRTRTQFRLVESIEAQEDVMAQIVDELD